MEKNFINYYQKMRELEIECRADVIKMLDSVGGSHTFVEDIILPCYDSNGDAWNTRIESVESKELHDGNKFLNIYTDNGRCCSLSEFTDCSIIFIYEGLCAEI
jgi:hypothetical protein